MVSRQVGLTAINDGVLLKCHVQAIIKRYFKEKFYFMDLMELWNEVCIIQCTIKSVTRVNICTYISMGFDGWCALFGQIGLQTAMGQMLDLITTHTGAKDLARYRIQGYAISLVA